MSVSIGSVRAGFYRAAAGAAAVAALTGGNAHAASQGTLGATSTGGVTIAASVPNRARITGLSDVAWVNVDPATAATATQNVCVWSNTATKRYTVTATGSGAANAFRLASGTLSVPFTVRWSGVTGAVTGTSLTRGTASAAFTSSATRQACTSGPVASASLIVGITAANLALMRSQTTYSGVLTLVVTPL
jgi:hypothetical protein